MVLKTRNLSQESLLLPDFDYVAISIVIGTSLVRRSLYEIKRMYIFFRVLSDYYLHRLLIIDYVP